MEQVFIGKQLAPNPETNNKFSRYAATKKIKKVKCRGHQPLSIERRALSQSPSLHTFWASSSLCQFVERRCRAIMLKDLNWLAWIRCAFSLLTAYASDFDTNFSAPQTTGQTYKILYMINSSKLAFENACRYAFVASCRLILFRILFALFILRFSCCTFHCAFLVALFLLRQGKL